MGRIRANEANRVRIGARSRPTTCRLSRKAQRLAAGAERQGCATCGSPLGCPRWRMMEQRLCRAKHGVTDAPSVRGTPGGDCRRCAGKTNSTSREEVLSGRLSRTHTSKGRARSIGQHNPSAPAPCAECRSYPPMGCQIFANNVRFIKPGVRFSRMCSAEPRTEMLRSHVRKKYTTDDSDESNPSQAPHA